MPSAPTMPMIVAVCVALIGVSYLLGAVPWSLLIGKWFYRVDLRSVGSGNLGATNTFRVLGYRAGVAALVLDIGKGAAAAGIGIGVTALAGFDSVLASWLQVLCMAGAVLGHSYSPYIRLRGGKGVATSAGGLLVLSPAATLLCMVLFVLIVYVSRRVSLGSLSIALIYPPLVWVLYPDNIAINATSIGLALLVIWRHRSNIVRLAKGTEPRLSFQSGGSHKSEEGSPHV